MSDYRHGAVTGSRWVRAARINIDNPIGGVPTVTFAEEEVVDVGGGDPITRQLSSVTVPFIPDEMIPVRDPATWALTGETFSGEQLYGMLASVYWKAAIERDTKEGVPGENSNTS